MSYDFRYQVADGVATVTFDRPEVLNALTFEVYAQFRDGSAGLLTRLRARRLLRKLRWDCPPWTGRRSSPSPTTAAEAPSSSR